MKLTFLVLAAAIVCGCTSKGATDVSGSAGSAELKIVRLEDGTRCAVLVGSYKAALSCDWSRP